MKFIVLLSVLCPILGAGMSKNVLYQAPDECRWSGFAKTDIVLVCNLRTINSELENTNFSVIQPQNTIRLRLECNDALFIQSSLSPGSFRSLIELRDLTIQYCKLGNLTEGSFRGLQDLRNLTLRTHNSDWSTLSLDIAANVFSDFRQLDRLDLSLNNIWSIPDGMICPLKTITHLNMTHNEIQDITNFHFSASLSTRKSRICGSSLIDLDFSCNKIANLPSAIFSALGRLRSLHLARNEMVVIADRAFEGLVSLVLVDLSGNRLTSLPPELFAEAKYVREVYLRNNSINVLAPGLFSDLTELSVLDLSANELNSHWVTTATFVGLKRLTSLDLSANKISKVEVGTFRSLRLLQVLKLQDNYIDSIPDHAFVELGSLHTLILSNNRLSTVSEYTLHGLHSLQMLSLDYNRIARIDRAALKNCSGLQDIHLNGNKLQSVPDGLRPTGRLTSLDLGENLITEIGNTSLAVLDNLLGLRLTENLIETIHAGVFHRLTSLQILNLSRNRIRTIEEGSFTRNRRLQAIRLDGNQLSTIGGLFADLPNLVWLNISENRLVTFDYAHIPIGLQWLDLHANRIAALLGGELHPNLGLSTFDASSNRLTEISATGIPNSVELLYLNDNQISKIQSYTFFQKPNLTRVDLFGNKLTTLEPNALRLSPVPAERKGLPEFHIGGNPFQCDCNLDWIQKINLESRTQPKLMDLASIYCRLAYNRGKSTIPLIEAQTNEFLCKYESHCFALCHCCDFYACDCKMECPNRCACYHDKSWTSNVVDCSRSAYDRQLPQHIPMDATQLYLDGNYLPELRSHAFLGRKRLSVLHLNHSHIEVVRNRTFFGLVELEVLQLDYNKLERLHGSEFLGLDNLKELHLQRNRISVIDNLTFAGLHQLRILRIDHNRLVEFAMWSYMPAYLGELRLAGNAWSCGCEFVGRLRDYVTRHDFVADRLRLRCGNATDLFAPDLCVTVTTPNNSVITIATTSATRSTKVILPQHTIATNMSILIAILAGCCCVIAAILLLFIYRREMRVCLHARFGIRLFDNAGKDGRDKLYDAFVSYSAQDEEWVAGELSRHLEQTWVYKLCLQHRDAAASNEALAQAIDASRRTIMILSENFMKTEWSRLEYKSAHHQVLRDRRRRLIVIRLGEEMPQRYLDQDLRLYLKANSFLQWGDKLFWQKLRYALPDVQQPSSSNQRRQQRHLNLHNASFRANTQPSPQPPPLQQQNLQMQQLHLHSRNSLSSSSSPASRRVGAVHI